MADLSTMLLWGQSGGSFWMPAQGSTVAGGVDNLFYFIYYVSVFFFVLIVFLMALFVVRFRRRPGLKQAPSPSHNTPLEIFWSVIPTMIVLVIFGWGFTGYMDMRNAPADAYEIQVTGRQWSWLFSYANGTKSDVLHVPVDRPVRLVMKSNDVIHSLYIPAFRIKMDLVPGRYTTAWFEATRTGTFDLLCAEYCGDSHSTMVSHCVVHPSGGFEAWLAEAGNFLKKMPPAEAGRELYVTRGCAQCHAISKETENTSRKGPNLAGIWGQTHDFTDGSSAKVDENYIRESILEPGKKVRAGFPNLMTTFKGVLSDEEIGYLIAFIRSLGNEQDHPDTTNK